MSLTHCPTTISLVNLLCHFFLSPSFDLSSGFTKTFAQKNPMGVVECISKDHQNYGCALHYHLVSGKLIVNTNVKHPIDILKHSRRPIRTIVKI
jgi:hypothetical protein